MGVDSDSQFKSFQLQAAQPGAVVTARETDVCRPLYHLGKRHLYPTHLLRPDRDISTDLNGASRWGSS